MERAGDILRSLLGKQAVEKGVRYHRLFSGWDELVGAPLAGRSEVVELQNGHLLVRVDHPAVLQILRMQERGILRNLQRRFSGLEVRTIRGVVGPAIPASVDATGEHTAEGSSSRESQEITSNDPDLRRALDELGALGDSRLRSALSALYEQATRQEHQVDDPKAPRGDRSRREADSEEGQVSKED